MAALLMRDPARMGRHTAALQQGLAGLQAASPREPMAERAWLLLLAELQGAQGQAAAAVQTLAAVPAVQAPGVSRRPVLLQQARAALAWAQEGPKGQPDPAAAAEARRVTEDLQTWVADHPQDAAAWEQLATTAEAAGLRLRAMRAAAEARAAVGDLAGAIDRLRAAQEQARDATGQEFIEASVIDARLRQLVAERRQLALESRRR
jgi:predicted Zn-dependent protease